MQLDEGDASGLLGKKWDFTFWKNPLLVAQSLLKT